MSNAWVLAPIFVIDVLFSLKFAAILEKFYFLFRSLQLIE
jgi:hypothetical protein